MLPPEDASVLVIRSSVLSRWRAGLLGLINGALLVGFSTALGGAVGLGISVPCALLLLALPMAYVLSYRIVLSGTHVGRTSWFGRMRFVPRAGVTGVVRVTLTPARGAPVDTLFLVDDDGRLLLRVPGYQVRRGDLDRLAEELRLPVGGPRRPLTARRFDEQYPGLVSWHERRPLLLALVTVGALPALIFVLVVALG